MADEALAADQPSIRQVARSIARSMTAEGLVRYEANAYSVPARWGGARVSVDAGDTVIHIRSDLIIAEHPVNAGRGQRTESPLHVQERWTLSVPIAPPAPPKGCHITFTQTVQVRPLSVYAEAAS